MAYLTWVYFILFFGILLAGCSDPRLLQDPPVEDPPAIVQNVGEFCIREPDRVETSTKFLFVMDKSGSNTGSDNGAVKRATNIERFIRNNISKSYYRYGMIAFNGDSATPYITDNNNRAGFTASPSEALAAANRLRLDDDEGQTPYQAALLQTRNAIENDIRENQNERSSYIVFFVSDGRPTDEMNPARLNELVKEITENQGRPVIFSTAFYGDAGGNSQVAQEAQDRLSGMAQAGGGIYVNFENTSNWDFNDLIVAPTSEPWQLKQLLVYNLNAGFCFDGSIDTDSDSDGLCDKDELSLAGFDPQNRFSFGDGFGDAFHWRRIKFGQSLPENCFDRNDDDNDFLTNCEERALYNASPSPGIPSSGLVNIPDTDKDGVLDGLETFVYYTKSTAYAMDSLNLLRNTFDGEEAAGLQIALHRNPLVKDSGKTQYDTTYNLLAGGQPGQDCYSFEQRTLPLYDTLSVAGQDTLKGLGHQARENKVLIYYIQTPQSDPNGDGVLKYSVQTLTFDPGQKVQGTDAGLNVSDDVFETYIIPER